MWFESQRKGLKAARSSLKDIQITTPEKKIEIFGQPLAKVLAYEDPPPQIPGFITKMIQYIEERALKIQGIFRISGDAEEIQALKRLIESGQEYDISTCDDPHAIGSLLKSYIRELPEPLIPFAQYPHFLAAQKLRDPTVRLFQLQQLLTQIPKEHYALLRAIINLAIHISFFSDLNNMTLSNLAIVFAPNFFRSGDADMLAAMKDAPFLLGVTKTLMENAETLFASEQDDEELMKEAQTQPRQIRGNFRKTKMPPSPHSPHSPNSLPAETAKSPISPRAGNNNTSVTPAGLDMALHEPKSVLEVMVSSASNSIEANFVLQSVSEVRSPSPDAAITDALDAIVSPQGINADELLDDLLGTNNPTKRRSVSLENRSLETTRPVTGIPKPGSPVGQRSFELLPKGPSTLKPSVPARKIPTIPYVDNMTRNPPSPTTPTAMVSPKNSTPTTPKTAVQNEPVKTPASPRTLTTNFAEPLSSPRTNAAAKAPVLKSAAVKPAFENRAELAKSQPDIARKGLIQGNGTTVSTWRPGRKVIDSNSNSDDILQEVETFLSSVSRPENSAEQPKASDSSVGDILDAVDSFLNEIEKNASPKHN